VTTTGGTPAMPVKAHGSRSMSKSGGLHVAMIIVVKARRRLARSLADDHVRLQRKRFTHDRRFASYTCCKYRGLGSRAGPSSENRSRY